MGDTYVLLFLALTNAFVVCTFTFFLLGRPERRFRLWRFLVGGSRQRDLRHAAMLSEMESLKKLLRDGGSINDASDYSGDTGLHTAAKWNFAEMAAQLLCQGAVVNATNHQGLTPLHCAASANSYDAARALLKGGARQDATALDGRVPFEMAGEDAMRSLCGGPSLDVFRAIAKRRHLAIRDCVEKGCDVSIRSANGDSALSASVRVAIDEREASLENWRGGDSALSASVRAAIDESDTTLELVSAVLQPSPGVARALSLFDRKGLMPLHLASAAKHVPLVASLLAAGANVDAATRAESGGKTALHLVLDGASNDDTDDDGNDNEEGKDDGDGADNVELVRLLLDYRANVNAEDGAQRTPLHQAVSRGLHRTVRTLLDAHADPTHPVKKQTCLHAAVFRNDAKVVQALLTSSSEGAPAQRLGACLDAPGRSGWTPLGFAARSGNLAIAKALLKAGAAPGVAMASGKTALDIAMMNNKTAVAELIASAPAPLKMDR